MKYREYKEVKSEYLRKFDSYDEMLDFFNNNDYQHFDDIYDLLDYVDGFYVVFEVGYCMDIYLRTDGKKFNRELLEAIAFYDVVSDGLVL